MVGTDECVEVMMVGVGECVEVTVVGVNYQIMID